MGTPENTPGAPETIPGTPETVPEAPHGYVTSTAIITITAVLAGVYRFSDSKTG
jgi:hypothetical protein